MVQKTGTDFPLSRVSSGAEYAVAISTALKTELGTSHSAIKTIMRWTGACDRTAKYWLAGTRGPGGRHLILMASKSDTVMHTLLRLADRDLFELAIELNAAKAALARASAIIDALHPPT